jgi:hypothetical protein
MCWNPEISLSTFILGVAAISIGNITQTNDLQWSLFYLSIVSMQLIEFFMWKNLQNPSLIKFLSMIGLLTIFLQPIVAGLLIDNKQIQILFYLMFILWMIAYIITSSPIKFNTYKSTNGHLAWEWLQPKYNLLIVLWTLFIIVPFWFKNGMNMWWKIIITLFTILFACMSWYFYHETKTWGSVYCSFINIMSVFILILAFFSQYKCHFGQKII